MLKINTPCKEDWNSFIPTKKGAFCDKCKVDVLDFSAMSNQDVLLTLKQNAGKTMCGKFKNTQIDHLNLNFHEWHKNSQKSFQSKFIFCMLVVFGLTLFSCTTSKDINAINQITTLSDSLTVKKKSQITETITPKFNYKEYNWVNPVSLDLDLNQFIYGDISIPDFLIEIEEEKESASFPLPKIDFTNEPKINTQKNTDKYTLDIQSNYNEHYWVYLYNFDEKIIYKAHHSLIKGKNIIKIDLTEYPKDKYKIVISSASQFKTIDFDNC